jgi:hypothetical protein
MKTQHGIVSTITRGVLAVVLAAAAAGLAGCPDGGDGGPGAGAGVTVTADGRLRIDAGVRLFDRSTTPPVIAAGAGVDGVTVTAYAHLNDIIRVPLGTGSVTRGRLSITIDQPPAASLQTVRGLMNGGAEGLIQTGPDVQVGAFSIEISGPGYLGNLDLYADPAVGTDADDPDGVSYFVDGAVVWYLYSHGDARIAGDYTGDVRYEVDGVEVDAKLMTTVDITLREGWNALASTRVTRTGQAAWATTTRSASPGAGAAWVYDPLFSGLLSK